MMILIVTMIVQFMIDGIKNCDRSSNSSNSINSSGVNSNTVKSAGNNDMIIRMIITMMTT